MWCFMFSLILHNLNISPALERNRAGKTYLAELQQQSEKQTEISTPGTWNTDKRLTIGPSIYVDDENEERTR